MDDEISSDTPGSGDRTTYSSLCPDRERATIAILAATGKGLFNVVLVLGIVSWVQYARIVRGSTLGVRSQEYVLGARALGATHARIISRHVLPNILPPILVVATINVSSNILAEAALSYLGVGVLKHQARNDNRKNLSHEYSLLCGPVTGPLPKPGWL